MPMSTIVATYVLVYNVRLCARGLFMFVITTLNV